MAGRLDQSVSKTSLARSDRFPSDVVQGDESQRLSEVKRAPLVYFQAVSPPLHVNTMHP